MDIEVPRIHVLRQFYYLLLGPTIFQIIYD
jgi:hypothetical protein